MVATVKSSGSKSKMTMRLPPASAPAGPSRPSRKPAPKARFEAGASDDEDAQIAEDNISFDEDDEPGTDDEIEAAKGAQGKSKKTAKRKRRATSPTSFGSTLQNLLGVAAQEPTEEEASDAEEESSKKPKVTHKTSSAAATPAILSLAPHLRRSAQSTSLSAKAARIALDQKKRREERCHVTDIIGGWGPPGVLPSLEDEDGNIIESTPSGRGVEASNVQDWVGQGGNQGYERKLRKVAQRGVVKLFNAIRAAQTTTEDDLETTEAKKSAKGAAVTAAASSKKTPGLVGKEARLADLSKNKFLDLIKTDTSSKSRNSVAAK